MKAAPPAPSPAAAARRAEALGARFPPLLVAAERVAQSVAQGVHGRRRTGQGDAFWQYRPFLPGDAVGRIAWRASGKGSRTFIRETEWEAAQHVALWRDASASMRWRSGTAVPPKHERAELLLLSLAALLLRGGERVRLLGASGPPDGRGLDALARQLDGLPSGGLPPPSPLPRHAKVVLVGDFLAPLEELRAVLAGMAAVPVTGHMLQVLDPAEALLPYAGRVRFEGLEQEAGFVVPRVEGIRGAYARALEVHQAGLGMLARTFGWSFATHRTDAPPESALLGLYTALAPATRGAGRA